MKRFLQIITLLSIIFLAWYFIIKPNDYNIHFKTSASTGHAYDELLNWSALADLPDTSVVKDQEYLREITQEVSWNGNLYVLNWSVKKINDSLTDVNAGVSQPGQTLLNRLMIPFADTDYEQKTLDLVQDYKSFLDESLRQFRIQIEGETRSPEKFCACTRSKSTPEQKAFKMMRDYNYISGFIASSKLTPQGNPMIKVLDYDEKHRIIEFDFCFPIAQPDSLPESPDIFFRTIEQGPALKAIYNGDYRFSNKSWFQMFEYAEKYQLPIKKLPLEIYHNNPNMGGDALKWTTEIYLPINRS